MAFYLKLFCLLTSFFVGINSISAQLADDIKVIENITIERAEYHNHSKAHEEKYKLFRPIIFYQAFISDQLQPQCIFAPSCSHYAYIHLKKNALSSVFHIGDRLLRCNAINAAYYLHRPVINGKIADETGAEY